MKSSTKRRVLSIILVFTIVFGTFAQTSTAEAGIASWLVKTAVKHVIKDKVVEKVKDKYQEKKESFTIEKKTITLRPWDEEELKPLITYGNKITWKSENSKIASVSSDGVVTGKSAGTTYIVAKTDKSNKTTKIKVNVKKFKDVKKTYSLKVGEIKTFRVCNSDFEKMKLIKKVKNAKGKIAEVVEYDLERAQIVGKKPGTTKITFTLENTQKVILTIKVKEKKEKPVDKETDEDDTLENEEDTASQYPFSAVEICSGNWGVTVPEDWGYTHEIIENQEFLRFSESADKKNSVSVCCIFDQVESNTDTLDSIQGKLIADTGAAVEVTNFSTETIKVGEYDAECTSYTVNENGTKIYEKTKYILIIDGNTVEVIVTKYADEEESNPTVDEVAHYMLKSVNLYI